MQRKQPIGKQGMKGSLLAQGTPRLSSQHKEDLFALEGKRAGNKR